MTDKSYASCPRCNNPIRTWRYRLNTETGYQEKHCPGCYLPLWRFDAYDQSQPERLTSLKGTEL